MTISNTAKVLAVVVLVFLFATVGYWALITLGDVTGGTLRGLY